LASPRPALLFFQDPFDAEDPWSPPFNVSTYFVQGLNAPQGSQGTQIGFIFSVKYP
jgi:hypothetical protein